MADALLTPFDFSAPVKAGRRRFWKQILPIKTIDYKGQKIAFDKAFHMDLADAFRKDAYDQVPIVFADSDNQHNMDPRNFGGDVLDIQTRKDGTWALIEADKEAAKAIEKNPRLGVSARIVQGLQKADGRTFKRAVQHVLLTMNPRVTGMSPWQAVDLSDEDADIEVVDLTAEQFEEGSKMATKTKAKTTSRDRQIDLSALSDEQFEALLDLATTLAPEDVEEDLDEEDLDDEVEETERKPRRKKSKTKVTIEKESEDDGDADEDEEEDEEDEEDAETDLSESETTRRSADLDQFQTMRIDLAEERWNRERGDYLDAGVPPFLLDLAAPLLSQPDATVIDLADGSGEHDATATIRQMLDGFKGLVDLTPEIGHALDLSDTKDEKDPDAKFLDAWDQQYG